MYNYNLQFHLYIVLIDVLHTFHQERAEKNTISATLNDGNGQSAMRYIFCTFFNMTP